MNKRGRPRKQQQEEQPQEESTIEETEVVDVEKFVGYHPITGVALFERIE